MRWFISGFSVVSVSFFIVFAVPLVVFLCLFVCELCRGTCLVLILCQIYVSIISACLVAPPRFFLGAFFSLAVGQSAKLGHLFPSSDWPKFPNLAGFTRVKILVSHPADLKSQTPLRVQLPPRRETRRARLGKMAVSINC